MNELKAFLWRHPDLRKKIKVSCLLACVREELSDTATRYLFNTTDVIEYVRQRASNRLTELVSSRELHDFRVDVADNQLRVDCITANPMLATRLHFSVTS